MKIWDSIDHRATMDIDLLARTSNEMENLRAILREVSTIPCSEDAIIFDTEKLILRSSQNAGEYGDVSGSFTARLFTTKVPMIVDIGFDDIIIPGPQEI